MTSKAVAIRKYVEAYETPKNNIWTAKVALSDEFGRTRVQRVLLLLLEQRPQRSAEVEGHSFRELLGESRNSL